MLVSCLHGTRRCIFNRQLGLLMYGNRLVIPASLRKEVLECLHAAHQGVAGMKARLGLYIVHRVKYIILQNSRWYRSQSNLTASMT